MMGKISNHRIKYVALYNERLCKYLRSPCSILFMHILDQPDGKRVICAGGQNGELFLGFYNKKGNELKSHAIRIFSPITSVLVFQPRASNKSKSRREYFT